MWLKNLRARPPKKPESDWFKKKPWANIITGKNEKKKKQRKTVLMSEKHEADEF